MSTLLDSLRRARRGDAAAPLAPGGGRQVGAVLSTQGYAPRHRRMGVLPLAVGGVAVVAVALLGWGMWERPASMPQGTRAAADLTVDEGGSPPPVAMPEGVAEAAVPPAPDADPLRVMSLDPPGDTVPRLVPDITNPVVTPDQTPSGATVETPSPPEEEDDDEEEEAADLGGPVTGTQPGRVETGRGGEPSGVAGTASAGGPGDAVTAPPPVPGDLAPPPVSIIERGPVVAEVFAAALALQRAGDTTGASAQYQTLLGEGTRSAQVHNNFGLLYLEQHRLDDAAREFQRAIGIDPRHSKAHNNLGVVRMGQARYEDAAAAFRDARRLDSTNLDAWVNLGLALQAAGDPMAARRTLVDALSVDARHASTHYNLARLFDLAGDASRAIEHYGRFVEHSGAEHAGRVEIVRGRIAALREGGLERR